MNSCPWVIAAGALVFGAAVVALLLRQKTLPAVVLVARGVAGCDPSGDAGGRRLRPEYSTRSLAAAVARYNRPDIPVYSVGGYQQTLPFYLRRKMMHRGLSGRIANSASNTRTIRSRIAICRPWAHSPHAWQSGSAALAFVPRELFNKVKALDIRYTVVAENPRWIALVPAP